MSKLNLDIFSTQDFKEKNNAEIQNNFIHKGNQKQDIPDPVAVKTKPVARSSKDSSPKFIPVGFYQEHLRLLDDAVVKLRREGHWKASKSAIIRNLINSHSKELEKFG